MLHNLSGWHLLILLAVLLLLFGAAKLPALAKSMGQSARAFKGEMRAMKEEETPPADGAAGRPNIPETSRAAAGERASSASSLQ